MQGGPAHAHIFKALEHFTMKGSGKIHVGKWRRNACRLYGFDTQVHSQRVAWLAQSPSLSGSTPVDRRKHKGITPQRAPHKKRLEEIKISCRMHKTYYMLPQRGVTTVWDFQRPDLEDLCNRLLPGLAGKVRRTKWIAIGVRHKGLRKKYLLADV
eukprot:scaffold87239_cov19-Tisochrysis_lutea.AAC.1